MAGEGSAPALQVDDKNLRAFLSLYKSLPQESGTVNIFDRKTCYSVHGEDAFMVARLLYRSTAQVSYIGGQEKGGLPGITFGNNLLPVLLRDLLVEQGNSSVALYEGAGGSWKRTKFASPAKLADFDDELNRGGALAEVPLIAAATMAIQDGARVVGLAFVDPSQRRIGACEFADDEQFCHLETALVQLGPKECVLPKAGEAGSMTGPDAKRLADVVSRCGALGSERPKAAFSTKALEGDLGRLLRGSCVEQYRPILERQQAAAAIAGLLTFAELLSDSSSHGKYTLGLHDTGRYMRLDSAAVRALNVLKSKTDSSDTFSLYGLLNRGKTPMGKRLLKVWLKQPLVDLDEIKRRHDVVEALVEDASLRQDLQMHLRGLPDIERLARKLDRQKASLADLCQLYRASSRLPQVQAVLEGHAGQHAGLLAELFATPLAEAHDEEHLSKFEELLEAAVDLDRVPDEYLIAPAYDDHLRDLQVGKEEAEQEIVRLAGEAAKDLGLVMDKTIKLEWHKVSNQRMRCLRITAKEEKLVRKKMVRYQELETRRDGVKFTSKALKEAAIRLQQLSGEYDSRQQHLVEQVVSVAATFCEVWERVCGLLAELDVLVAFADLSTAAPKPYIRPTMLPGEAGEVVLEACRHPCVEAQDGVEFIPNDCIMRRGESWFQVITGPNMGGKSTFIRQVGVAVLLAQVGCFVPCDAARMAVRDCIFARVGAGDCQLRGVSTFMAEMLETAAILKGATSKSLVIIDELGRGTSTYDGQALAWSISEHLMREIGCATLFATHFHELTALTGEVGVKNLHVTSAIDEQSGSLTMLYQVHEGGCDQSFGIHVAEFAKFPPEVVELAKRKAEELEQPAQQQQQRQELDEGEQQQAKRARQESREGPLSALLLDLAELPLEAMPEEEAREALQRWAAQVAPLLPPVS